MMGRKMPIGLLLMLFVLLGEGAAPSVAQEASSAGADREQPKPAGITSPAANLASDSDANAAPLPPPGAVNPYGGDIKDAGTGLPLFGTSATPLRWGDFSIGQFEYIGIHDEIKDTGAVPGTSTTLSILRTSLVFDRLFWKSRVVLQYLPQAVFADGQFHANAQSNNTVSLGTTFMLSPRMHLTVQDTFAQVHDNQLIPENYLARDSMGGGVVQNNFLSTNGSFLANTASAVLQYDLSPVTSLDFSPSFRYSRATINTTPGQQFQNIVSGETYEGSVALTHALYL